MEEFGQLGSYNGNFDIVYTPLGGTPGVIAAWATEAAGAWDVWATKLNW